MTRSRLAWITSLAVAAAVGFWVSGPVLYKTFIGLDATAFPAGAVLDRIGKSFLPDAGFSVAGLVYALLLGLPAAALAFLLELLAGTHADPLAYTTSICEAFGYDAFVVQHGKKLPGLPTIASLGKNTSWGTEIETRNVLFMPRA